jgi:hypothetical protein
MMFRMSQDVEVPLDPNPGRTASPICPDLICDRHRFVGHLDLPNSLPKNATANNSAMMAAARRAGVRIS